MTETAESLAARIREDIRSGRLNDGDPLPSINKLVQQYRIGRGAAQAAMSTLLAEGVICSRPGAGYYVRKRFARIERVSPDRLARAHREAGRAVQDHDTGDRRRRAFVEVDEVPAPDFVARAFDLDEGAPVVRRRRVYDVDGRPVQLAISYYPVQVARGTPIVYSDPGPGGVLARLAEMGLEPTDYEERLIARAPAPEEIEALSLRRSGAVVFQITRYARVGPRCVEVTWMVLDAAVYEPVYKFPAT